MCVCVCKEKGKNKANVVNVNVWGLRVENIWGLFVLLLQLFCKSEMMSKVKRKKKCEGAHQNPVRREDLSWYFIDKWIEKLESGTVQLLLRLLLLSSLFPEYMFILYIIIHFIYVICFLLI